MTIDTPPDPRVASRLRAATWGASVLSVVLALYAAWNQDWTYDEPLHLHWSERLLDTGVTERTSQWRYMSKTPVLIPHVVARRSAAASGIQDPRGLRLAARLPTVVALVALLAATFWLARTCVGGTAARLATIATALDPNVVAHGSLTTVDVLFAATTVLTLGTALQCVRRPTLASGALLGLAMGAAFATKFTAMFLLPGLALLPLLSPGSDRSPGWTKRLLAAGVAAVAVAWGVVCGAYLFLEMGQPLGGVTWYSAPMQALARRIPGLIVPIPTAFLTGLDVSFSQERQDWNVVLLGRRHPHGVWYYFAMLWLIKTPLALVMAQMAGFLRAGRALLTAPATRFVAFNLVLLLAYFSFLFQTQLGYRFVLMCVPLGYVLAASGWTTGPATPLRRAGWLVLLVTLAEHALYVGNPLSFTNAAVWPKRQVFRLMADSNVDWGQNRDKVARWTARLPIGDPFLDPLHLLPGQNVISLNAVAGVGDFEQHRWLREHLAPRDHLGHTYLWFEIDEATFDRFLDEARRLAPTATRAALCNDDLPYERFPPGSRPGLSLTEAPEPNKEWLACVSVRKPTEFGLKSVEGRIRFGPHGAARLERIDEGRTAWYRLEPGIHVFRAVEIPNRRPWLPYRFEGKWLVRGHGASLHVRQVGRATPLEPESEEGLLRRDVASGVQ